MKSLLYTADEVALGTRRRAGGNLPFLQLLLQSYRGMCPFQGDPGLQVATITSEPREHVHLVVGRRQRVAPMVGSHVVCCKCVITLVQVLMKIGKVLKKGGETNLDRATMMRFMFMPGQQLVNLFPARRRRPKPAARAESPE